MAVLATLQQATGPESALFQATAYRALARTFPWRRTWTTIVSIYFWLSAGMVLYAMSLDQPVSRRAALSGVSVFFIAIAFMTLARLRTGPLDDERAAREILSQKRANAVHSYVEQHGQITDQLKVHSTGRAAWHVRRFLRARPELHRRVRKAAGYAVLAVMAGWLVLVYAVFFP